MAASCAVEWPRYGKRMLDSGQVTVLENVRDGLDAAPAALIEMMAGKNIGQLAVRLGPDPEDVS
jgi:NADPH-dependent curcumin reductase CurA